MVAQKHTKRLLLISIFFTFICAFNGSAAATAESSDDFARQLAAQFNAKEENLRLIESTSRRLSASLTRTLGIISAEWNDAATIASLKTDLQDLIQSTKEVNALLHEIQTSLNILVTATGEALVAEARLRTRLRDIEGCHINATGSASHETNDAIEGKAILVEGYDKVNMRIGILKTIQDKAPEVLALCATLQGDFQKLKADYMAAIEGHPDLGSLDSAIDGSDSASASSGAGASSASA